MNLTRIEIHFLALPNILEIGKWRFGDMQRPIVSTVRPLGLQRHQQGSCEKAENIRFTQPAESELALNICSRHQDRQSDRVGCQIDRGAKPRDLHRPPLVFKDELKDPRRHRQPAGMDGIRLVAQSPPPVVER